MTANHLLCSVNVLAALAFAIAAQLSSATQAADAVPDLQSLVGATVDVRLTNGQSWGDAKVEKIRPGSVPGAIRAMTITPHDPPRQQTLGAQSIDEIFLDGKPLDVSFDKKTRELAHNPEKRQARLQREAAIEERVRSKKGRFWKEISPEDQAKYLAEEKDFLQKLPEKMNLPMQLLETKYFLFYTDMSLKTVGVYVKYLDAMYEKLTHAFDVPQGKNIWRGKCVVVAFQNPADFHRYERDVMKFTESEGAQALCHSSSNGRVLIAGYKGNSESFFAVVLVHETAHGFVHRYKTTLHVVPWINEGIAEWVAQAVVGKLNDEVRRRQGEAVERIRQTGTLGGTFFADNIRLERYQYGAASSIVDVLLRIDPKKYRKLIDNVKEGMDSEEALRDAYGFGHAELAQRYGATFGARNVRP